MYGEEVADGSKGAEGGVEKAEEGEPDILNGRGQS